MSFADEMLLWAFTGTLFLTIIWLLLAQRWNIYDAPEQRRLHRISTVRGGGISIAIVMLICCAYIWQNEYELSIMRPAPIELVAFMLAGAACIGLVDDLFALKPSYKLLSYGLLVLSLLVGMSIVTSLSIWLTALIAMGLVLQINVWNFMDGSNGLISIQAILITLAYLVTDNNSPIISCYAFALLACCLAFLPFNFPKARMFLGDVGSHALGAAVFGLFVMAYCDGKWGILEILVLSSALWIDAVLTFLRRYFRGFKVTQAHRSHLYQYLIRSGQTHTAVCFYYAAWAIAAALMLGLSKQLPEAGQRILLLSLLAVGCVLHQWLRLFVLKSRHSQKKSKNLF